MFDLRRIKLFCLEKRLSKHKMTISSKNFLGGMTPSSPPLDTPMLLTTTGEEGLNGLALLQIHRKVKIDLEFMVYECARRHN